MMSKYLKKLAVASALVLAGKLLDEPVVGRVNNSDNDLTKDYISSLVDDARNTVFDSNKIDIAKKIVAKTHDGTDADRRAAYFALKQIRTMMVFDSSKETIRSLMEKLV